MKKVGWLLFLAVPLMSGCVPFLFTKGEKAPEMLLQPTPPPLVTADRIDEQNAMESANALREELEYDMNRSNKVQPAPTKK